jgi:hypothetical protein
LEESQGALSRNGDDERNLRYINWDCFFHLTKKSPGAQRSGGLPLLGFLLAARKGKLMIEITIKLETDKVESAIRDVWQKEFMHTDGYGRGEDGKGWQEVQRQVREHIATLDLSQMIATAAKARLANVVDEAVTIALREKAKQRAKEMMKDGSLLS